VGCQNLRRASDLGFYPSHSCSFASSRLLPGHLRLHRIVTPGTLLQLAPGIFTSTFVYAMVVYGAVTSSAGHHPFVPRIAVTGAFVLVLASVGLFIFYIHHVANMIRVATIVTNLGSESRDLLERRYPAVRTVAAPRAGVLVSVNERALVELACRAGCVVVLAARAEHGTGPGVRVPPAGRYRRAALSPSTNDPTTACQALDMLHDLLRWLSARHLPTGRLTGPDGSLRLIVPQYGFADFVDLAVQETWRYGSDAAQVPRRISAMLAGLSAAALPEHLPVLRLWAARIGGGADRWPS
jgi:uncharacterized membrane protein